MFFLEQFLTLNLLAAGLLFLAILSVLIIIFLVLKFKKLFILILALPGILLFYSMFIEPNLLVVKKYNFDLKNYQGEKIKMAVIGDYQVKSRYTPSYLDYVIKKINQQNPDYIIWVGDLLHGNQIVEEHYQAFANINSNIKKIAILGNHDYANQTRAIQILEQYNFQVLVNKLFIDEKIAFVGIADLWNDKNIPYQNLTKQAQKNNKNINLLIAHQPKSILNFDNPEFYDLTLSGHCHGGQISLGPLDKITPLPIVPPGCFKDHAQGLYQIDNNWLLTTPGIGSLGVRARFMVLPEITLLILE